MAEQPEVFTPDVPGRGAWSVRGGLVSNTGSNFGYYQVPVGKPAHRRRPGAAYARGEDTSDSAYCVYLGVLGIQQRLVKLLGLGGPLGVDGVYGDKTQDAMGMWQESAGLGSDGAFGPRSASVFYRGLMVAAGRAAGVPWRFLYGMAARESAFDPAAVGMNGYDHGIIQINLDPGVHGGDVSREEAVSVPWALSYAADRLAASHRRWDGETSADPWDVAIAQHNSPALAQKWGETGVAPYVEGRIFQIEDYVVDIRARGALAP